MSTDAWINEMQCTPKTEKCLAFKKKEDMACTKKCVCLEDITLSEINSSQKDKDVTPIISLSKMFNFILTKQKAGAGRREAIVDYVQSFQVWLDVKV